MEIDTDMDIEMNSNESSYLKGIQNLTGTTPTEKRQHLNTTINELLATAQNNDDIISLLKEQGFSDSMIPLAQILIGNKTKSYESVLHALKSTDYRIVRKALQAKWFFNSTNEYLQIDFFVNNIIPHLSVRNRYKIINVVSRCLVNSTDKAESFFEVLFNQYGLEYALPFLPYCSEIFIFNTILTHKIYLSDKLFDTIYRMKPQIAIRYLHLGNEHNMNNIEERKVHKIDTNRYSYFLPKIIKTFPQDCFEFLRYLSPKKFSNKTSNFLCKSFGETIAENAPRFVGILSLKSISNNLSEELFEKFYINLYRSHYYPQHFCEMLHYLKYRLTNNRLRFMMDKMTKYDEQRFTSYFEHPRQLEQLQYNVGSDLKGVCELLSQEEFETLYLILFNNKKSLGKDMLQFLKYYPTEQKLELIKRALHSSKKDYFENIKNISTIEILELFPRNVRELKAAKLIETCDKNSDQYFKWCCYLPLKDSYNILKNAAESSNYRGIVDIVKKMIDTCVIYDDQKHLLLVMTYFHNVYVNNPSVNVSIILKYIADKFSIKSLDESNWQIFYELLLKIYIKDQFYIESQEYVEKILHEALYRLFDQSSQSPSRDLKETQLNKIIEMYLEYKIEVHNETKWTVFEKYPMLEYNFIRRVINEIGMTYSETHAVWKENEKKLKILTGILNKMIKYNSNVIEYNLTENDSVRRVLKIQNYPWLLNSTIDVLKDENLNDFNFYNFKNLVKRLDPEFYLSILNQIRFHSSDIMDGKAQFLLKIDKQDIISNSKKYLSECQKLLCSHKKSDIEAAKKFIRLTIWYQDLPIKMYDQCLLEIHEPGSLKVLGLYLDSQHFNNIISKYYPIQSMISVESLDARKMYRIQTAIPAAISVSEPPLPLEIFSQFYRGEYFSLAKRFIVPLGQRIDKSHLITVATQFVKSANHLSKYGIHLIFQISSNDELYEFCKEINAFHTLKHLNKLITRKVFNRFKTSPNPKTWLLINNWIDMVNTDDSSLEILCTVSQIKNSYTQNYIVKMFNKIDELQHVYNMYPTWREKYIQTILTSITEDQIVLLSRTTILNILRRYYSKSHGIHMEIAVKSFGRKVFSLSFDQVRSLAVA